MDEIITLRLANTDGEILWNEKVGGPAMLDDRAWDVVVDGNGDVIVTGFSANADETADFLTIKHAGGDGHMVWERRMPGAVNNTNRGGWLAALPGGDIVMANRTWLAGVSFDVVLQRYASADGSVLWSEQYNGPASAADDPRDMIPDGAGNVVVVGVSDGDFMTLRFDVADGNLLWQEFLDGPMGWYDLANCAAPGPDGSVIVAGFTDGGSSTWDATVAAYDLGTGDELWTLVYDGADGLTDELRAVSLSEAGDLYVAGYSYAYATDMDMLALRYEFGPTDAPVGNAAGELAAWPNPFRRETTLRLHLPRASRVTAAVFDVSGRRVRLLADGDYSAGEHPLVWDGLADGGRPAPAGVYFLRARTEAGERTARVLRLR